VRACTQCRGQWVQEAVLAEMMMAMLPAGVPGGLALVLVARHGAPIACPSCGVTMERVTLCGVEVDRCPKDHGVWFDPEELQVGLRRYGEDPARRDWAPHEPEPPPPLPPPPPPSPRRAAPVASSNPTIERVVSLMRSGAEFRVGSDVYCWDDERGGLIVIEGTRAHAISEAQLRQVVANYPVVFGGRKATLPEVIERMKHGERFQYGGGRIFEVFGWNATYGLYVDSVVDGEESRGPCSESRLAEAIAESPQVFADA